MTATSAPTAAHMSALTTKEAALQALADDVAAVWEPCGTAPEGCGVSARRKVLAVALTTITIMCLLWCILRLQADGFAILAAVTFVALGVTIGAHRRSFWA